ncbi:hypothetical protein [Paraburkholderia sp. BL23I1N1]|uniref:hypothetical protein n=1 Tax=Paraburkholderia sp. BL23I1N1 TaxID=1938802 RepID=UPI0011C362C2|nr:hypothetical protein [Paraburkholderia sp. BL23I1N1]
MGALLNKKGFFASSAAPLLRRTSLPGKRCGKIALSSSNDRSRKNPEFPYAENYAVRVNLGNELPSVDEQSDFSFLSNAGNY